MVVLVPHDEVIIIKYNHDDVNFDVHVDLNVSAEYC